MSWNHKNFKGLFIFLGLVAFLPLQGGCNKSSLTSTTLLSPTAPGGGGGAGTIPPAVLMPSAAPVPITSVPGSGLWAVGAIVGYVTSSYGYSVTIGAALVTVSVNNAIETTDTVVITGPTGPVTLPYTASVSYSGYAFSQYGGTITYTPGSSYSMYINSSWGTANGSIASVPGNINFSANGSSVTAVYGGNYNAAVVVESSPTYAITYQNAAGSSVSNPFTYPSSAYASAPATYYSTYCAAVVNTVLGGTAGPTGAFVASGLTMATFTR